MFTGKYIFATFMYHVYIYTCTCISGVYMGADHVVTLSLDGIDNHERIYRIKK